MSLPTIFDFGYFVSESFLTNTSISDGAVGQYLWDIDAISAGADTLTYETAGGETFLHMVGGGAGDGDGTSLSLGADSASFGTGGGYIAAEVQYPSITGNALAGNNFRIGIIDVADSSEPVVGVWIDSDAGVLSIDAASANGDVTANVTGVPTDILTSGTTMILDTKYNFELRWSGSNANSGPSHLEFYVNGHLGATLPGVLLGSTETAEPRIVHWSDTGGAATLDLYVYGVEIASYKSK